MSEVSVTSSVTSRAGRSVLVEGGDQPAGQLVVLEVGGRHVDGDGERHPRRGPAGAGGQRLGHHEGGHLPYPLGVHHLGQEGGREQHAPVGVTPADQRLQAHGGALGEGHLGLEVHLELAVAHRPVQAVGRRRAGGPAAGRGGRRRPDARLAVAWPAYMARSASCRRCAGSSPWSGARAMPMLMSTTTEVPSSRNGSATAARSSRASVLGPLPGAVGNDHGELVTAQAAQQLSRAQPGQQPAGQLDQQPVAGGMAQRVVDHLEVVEIAQQQGQAGRR